MSDDPVRDEKLRHDLASKRPFEDYLDQPDTAERKRREMEKIAFALPEKTLRPPAKGWSSEGQCAATSSGSRQTVKRSHAAAASFDSESEGEAPWR